MKVRFIALRWIRLTSLRRVIEEVSSRSLILREIHVWHRIDGLDESMIVLSSTGHMNKLLLMDKITTNSHADRHIVDRKGCPSGSEQHFSVRRCVHIVFERCWKLIRCPGMRRRIPMERL